MMDSANHHRVARALLRIGSAALVAIGCAACGTAGTGTGTEATTSGIRSTTSPPPDRTAVGGLTELLRLPGSLSGREVPDVSGHDNDGQAAGSANGVVEGGTVSHPFLSFANEQCSLAKSCLLGVVLVDPKATSVLPGQQGRGPFAYGAQVRLLAAPPTKAGMNVMQRGLFGAGSAQWKLQADYGKPSCRWSDGTRVLELPNKQTDPAPSLRVNMWYGLRCERAEGGRFSLVVDDDAGVSVFRVTAEAPDIGSILPEGPMLIGANSVAAKSQELSDQLHADVRDVFFATTSP